MVKVLHVVSGDLWAGAEVVTANLLRELKACSEIELSVVVLNEGEFSGRIRGQRIPIYVLDEEKLSFIEVCWSLRKIVKALAPNIIHSHRYKENILSYLGSVGEQNRKLVTTQHGLPEMGESKKTIAYHFASKLNRWLLFNKYDCLVAVSFDIATRLASEYGSDQHKIHAIHNGLSIPPDVPKRIRNKPFIIGSAGRLFPVKDYPLLIEVAREVSRKAVDICFRLAGDGPELSRLRSLVAKYRLDDTVTFLGSVTDMEGFYKGLDIYINTSLHEGVPMSVLEAMAYGLPVVAPRVGGLVEIMTDQLEGFLVENRDPTVFAEKCVRLAMNRDEWSEMSLNAHRRVEEHFSARQMARHYHDLYMNLMDPSYWINQAV